MKLILIQVLIVFVPSLCWAMNFTPPTLAERLRAIGSTDGLSEPLRRAFDPGDDFEPIPAPASGDWLAVHPEAGQTFDVFLRSRPNRPDAVRNKIYLQPLGDFPRDRSPSVVTLREYATAYFVMDVGVLRPLMIRGRDLTTRINPFSGNRQILTTDVLELLRKELPEDAFCVLAITMEDLYPHPSWNFVFGQASLRERVGVFSFARYDPAFYGEERGGNAREVLLRRSCKVLAHETAHMFSMAHCIFFSCVLNGSNHLQESDARPLSLCPVCLRKLQFSIGFDVIDRYRRLLDFYREVGFEREETWVETRLKRVTSH